MIEMRNKVLTSKMSLFLVCVFLLSIQSSYSQSDETLNQKDFMLLIFQAKQLDTVTETNIVNNQASVDDFATRRTYSDTINTASILGKKRYLEHLGYCPEGGYNLDKILTYGDFAVTLVKVLHLAKPDNPTLDDYIAILVELGIMEKNDAEAPMPRQEVLDALDRANIPAIEIQLPDYQKPLSAIE